MCLDNVTSQEDELADQDLSDEWIDVHMKCLRQLFEDQIACDVSFHFGAGSSGTTAVIGAHRCILESCHFKPFMMATTISKNEDGHIDVFLNEGTLQDLSEDNFRQAVALCYGIPSSERDDTNEPITSINAVTYYYKEILDQKQLIVATSYPKKSMSDDIEAGSLLLPSLSPDVKIVASPGASDQTDVVWSIEGFKALLCAHSEYFRSTHQRWSSPDQKVQKSAHDEPCEGISIMRLDSTQFTKETVLLLVSCCSGKYPHGVPFDMLFELIHGATYFGMKAASLQCEEALALELNASNFAHVYQFAEDHGAERLKIECHKFVCQNLKTIHATEGAIAQLQRSQLEAVLQSDFTSVPEDDILNVLMTWADQKNMSFNETKELIRLVRLPFVPVDSLMMTKAIERNFVEEDMIKICRLFQNDGDYRTTMMNNGSMYRLRLTNEMQQRLKSQHRKLQEMEDYGDPRMMVCRMLGQVNGRENFHKIRSIQMNETEDHVMCVFPKSKKNEILSLSVDFPFGSITTNHMPTADDRYEKQVDCSYLETLEIEEVKRILAAMLKREDSMRLHPKLQSVLGAIGENEQKMSEFTTALQAYVANEFNVDPVVGIELIRSATTLFPEMAKKYAHYVRHNRCFQGNLKVGNDAPDVNLLTIDGMPTSLWIEINKRRHHCEAVHSSDLLVHKQMKPVVILGASFT